MSLPEDSRREVCAHASLRQNLMLMPVDSRDRSRQETTVVIVVVGTRFVAAAAAAAERLYARFVKLCKVHGARRGNSVVVVVVARVLREGCAYDAHDRHVRGAAFAAEMQMVTSLLGLSHRSSLSRAGRRVACAGGCHSAVNIESSSDLRLSLPTAHPTYNRTIFFFSIIFSQLGFGIKVLEKKYYATLDSILTRDFRRKLSVSCNNIKLIRSTGHVDNENVAQ